MGILFGILLMLNLANPETRDFVNQTIENNKKYDCKFVYKGLSQPVNRPAITLYGYTICNSVVKLVRLIQSGGRL